MTDQKWQEIRERWRLKVKDGDMKCEDDWVPYVVGNDGVPWMWVSRACVERHQEFRKSVELQKSVGIAKELLQDTGDDDDEHSERSQDDGRVPD